jgi:Cu+-exporting ATPase
LDSDKVHTDPVCGMDVSEENAAAKSHHDGQTYYFCSTQCKERFDLKPEDYVTFQFLTDDAIVKVDR